MLGLNYATIISPDGLIDETHGALSWVYAETNHLKDSKYSLAMKEFLFIL